VDRLELVELIEAQTLKLSPRARELWDKLDALIYLSDDDQGELFTPEEYALIERMAKLPWPESAC
jgi:hypothetical protein